MNDINIKMIAPLFNRILVTADRRTSTKTLGGTTLIDARKTEGTLLEYQKVVAVGNQVKTMKPGDLVCIDPSRYAKKLHQAGSLKDNVITDNPVITYNFEMVVMDGVEYILLYDSDISFIVTEYEPIN